MIYYHNALQAASRYYRLSTPREIVNFHETVFTLLANAGFSGDIETPADYNDDLDRARSAIIAAKQQYQNSCHDFCAF